MLLRAGRRLHLHLLARRRRRSCFPLLRTLPLLSGRHDDARKMRISESGRRGGGHVENLSRLIFFGPELSTYEDDETHPSGAPLGLKSKKTTHATLYLAASEEMMLAIT